jgi:hypothetical protein
VNGLIHVQIVLIAAGDERCRVGAIVTAMTSLMHTQIHNSNCDLCITAMDWDEGVEVFLTGRVPHTGIEHPVFEPEIQS